jgi:hypothetical protein
MVGLDREESEHKIAEINWRTVSGRVFLWSRFVGCPPRRAIIFTQEMKRDVDVLESHLH